MKQKIDKNTLRSLIYDGLTAEEIDAKYDYSHITDLSNFLLGYNLPTFPAIDTSNVTTMRNMFQDATKLKTIPLIDTSNVEDMTGMFSNSPIETIPLLDTSSVTNMDVMFQNCISLTTIPLLDTSNVSSMVGMFRKCSSLETIPLINTSRVRIMASMFNNCQSLESVPPIDTSNVIELNHMFAWCYSLKSVPLLDTSKVINASYMLFKCDKLESFPDFDFPMMQKDGMVGFFAGTGDLIIADGVILASATSSTPTERLQIFRNKLTLDQLIKFEKKIKRYSFRGCINYLLPNEVNNKSLGYLVKRFKPDNLEVVKYLAALNNNNYKPAEIIVGLFNKYQQI